MPPFPALAAGCGIQLWAYIAMPDSLIVIAVVIAAAVALTAVLVLVGLELKARKRMVVQW